MRSATRSGLVVAGVLYAFPALAQEEVGKGGLPQFDTSLFPEQLFWLAITFTVLYLLMSRVALPRVETVQAKRKNVIDIDLNTARAANLEAEKVGHEATKAMADARANANVTVTTMKAEASQLAAEQHHALSTQLAQKLRDAEAAIAKTRDAAMKEVKGTVADLAAAIVENVSGAR